MFSERNKSRLWFVARMYSNNKMGEMCLESPSRSLLYAYHLIYAYLPLSRNNVFYRCILPSYCHIHESLESGVVIPTGKSCEYLRTHVCWFGALQVRMMLCLAISSPPIPATGKSDVLSRCGELVVFVGWAPPAVLFQLLCYSAVCWQFFRLSLWH